MHRHTAGSRASAKFLHRPTRSLRRTISLLSTFGAVAGVQLQTSRSIKPRERDLGDLRLFFLARFLTRPTNHPRHAACASNFKSKPVRPRKLKGKQYKPIVAIAQRLWGLESRRFTPFCSPIFPRDKYKVLGIYKIVRVASQTDWRVGARLP